MRRAVIALALILAACSREPRGKSFILATTTSLQGSGVLPLRNVYALILPRATGSPDAPNAERFVEWLLRGRGHSLLETYEIKGKRAFHMM